MSDSQGPPKVLGAESSVQQMMNNANRAMHFASDGQQAASTVPWLPGLQPGFAAPQFPPNHPGAYRSPGIISPPAGDNLYQPTRMYAQAGQAALSQFDSPAQTLTGSVRRAVASLCSIRALTCLGNAKVCGAPLELLLEAS